MVVVHVTDHIGADGGSVYPDTAGASPNRVKIQDTLANG
ncbi:hypothetical protein ABH940_003194 [Streptacidiphilus sp. BW17]